MSSYICTWQRVEDSMYVREFRAIFADVYSELFTPLTAATVDIFTFGTLKQSLDIESARFAEDELDIEMDYAMCLTDNDRDCFDFILAAQSPLEERFLLVEINESGTWQTVFRGLIDSKMSADEYHWSGAAFTTSPDPSRVWKFIARVYNNAVLDIPLTELIPEEDTEAILAFELAHVANRRAYATTPLKDHTGAETGYIFGAYYGALVDINKVMRLYLDYAELRNSSLNFKAVIDKLKLPYVFTCNKIKPAYFRRKGDLGPQTIKTVYIDKIERNVRSASIYIGDPERNIDISPISESSANLIGTDKRLYINWFMARPRSSVEKSYSFHTTKTLLGLFYEIARSLSLFVSFNYVDGVLHIVFRTREQIFKDTEGNVLTTYLCDVEKATLTTEPVLINASTEKYVGISCNYAADGTDSYKRSTRAGDGLASELYKEYSKNKNRLLITISDTYYEYNSVNKQGYDNDLPHTRSLCAVDNDDTSLPAVSALWFERQGIISHNAVCYARNPVEEQDDNYDQIRYADISTAIYVQSQDFEYSSAASVDYGEEKGPASFDQDGTYDCYRPVSGLVINIDGVTRNFNSLSDYINEMVGRDGTFLKKEYSIVVPYLTRFKSAPDSGESFFNVYPGRTVILDGNSWVIVSVERDLNNFSTSIKLRLLERYEDSQTQPDDDELDETLSGDNNVFFDNNFHCIKRKYKIEGSIYVGDPVALMSNGLVERAFPTESYYGRIIGVSLTEYVGDYSAEIDVCVGGICDARLEYAPGVTVWLRDNTIVDSNGRNISNEAISDVNASEHLYQSLGYALEGGLMFVELSQSVLMEY